MNSNSPRLASALTAVAIVLVIGVLIGVSLIATFSTTRIASLSATARSESETPMPTLTSSPTQAPTIALTITPRATATHPPLATLKREPSHVVEHFLFGRPLALDAPTPVPNPLYLYGTTELGAYNAHAGVDFDRNPMLWMVPLPRRGVLAGRYADVNQLLIPGAIIDIYLVT